MQLEELEVIPYSLPFREPYVTARGELTERRLILVRIRGEGMEGLGETAALSLRGGPDIDRIAAEIRDRCWPALLDGGVDRSRIWSAIARCRNRGAAAEAVAAVDIALHDLVGKANGDPVWRLLGAAEANPVVCNATLPAANPSETRRMAEDWRAQGFRTFKLKVGLAGDVTQVATVRQTLGPDAVIRVDANGAWSVADAADRMAAAGTPEGAGAAPAAANARPTDCRVSQPPRSSSPSTRSGPSSRWWSCVAVLTCASRRMKA